MASEPACLGPAGVCSDRQLSHSPEQSPLLRTLRTSSSQTRAWCSPSCPASSYPHPVQPRPPLPPLHKPVWPETRVFPDTFLLETLFPHDLTRSLSPEAALRLCSVRESVLSQFSVLPVRPLRENEQPLPSREQLL